MQEEKKFNSRITFLKKLPVALISVFGLGLIGLGSEKLQRSKSPNIKSIPESEAKDDIRNMPGSSPLQIKPEPPPKSL